MSEAGDSSDAGRSKRGADVDAVPGSNRSGDQKDDQQIYAVSLGLLTDLYQLTMAQAAWQKRCHELRAVFHLTLRRCPFGGDFAIAAGIEQAIDYARDLRFTGVDLDYLATLRSRSGAQLFDQEFLRYLSDFEARSDVLAVDEGETLLAGAPMVRVEGGLLEAQLLETPLLNLIGMQTLVATRAARICHWAAGAMGGGTPQPVLEFGLRRAHGIDGAISVSRAAYLGGCAATSNLLAGRLFGIPVSGTHAHSWVLSFEREIEAFRAYADCFPDDTTLLVDTFATKRGVERAATVGRELASSGHQLVGVRLDSGDLAELSRGARAILDASDLPLVRIAASSDLDEDKIYRLRAAGAPVDVWGVGSRLATSHGDGSFGGAYKLSAIEDPLSGTMRPVAKISEDPWKRSLPGRLQIKRTLEDGQLVGDHLFEQSYGESDESDSLLLHQVLRQGRRCRAPLTLEQARQRAARCALLLGWNSSSRPELEPGSCGPPAHGVVLEIGAEVEAAFRSLLDAQD